MHYLLLYYRYSNFTEISQSSESVLVNVVCTALQWRSIHLREKSIDILRKQWEHF